MLQTPATLQMIQDIKQGLIPVGKAVEADNATSAENDGNGDNIANTYAKQNGSYPDMSVGTAVSAADATHATDADNDGDGNNIAATYAKKGGRLIPVVYDPPAGRPLSGYNSEEVAVGDIALVIDTDDESIPIGALREITGYILVNNFLCFRLSSENLGNILGPEGKYDVGDYYISNSSTSPAAKYGGSWTQLQGRFILGAGMGYVLGATGGEANVTLTVDQMPNHDHGVIDGDTRVTVGFSFGAGIPGVEIQSWSNVDNVGKVIFTDAKGGNQSHNNMPPYRVAYIWYRVL